MAVPHATPNFTQQIVENAKRCRRPPGEPRLALELSATGRTGSRSGNVPEPDSAARDNREMNRRNAAAKARVFVRIYFNGKEVCQTASKNLISGDDFVVHIGQIFPIQIMQLPESVTLQVLPKIRAGAGKKMDSRAEKSCLQFYPP